MRTIVFVHGYTCDQSDWKHQVEYFSPKTRVFTPELRGHGANPGTPAEVSIETFGADVAALLEQHDLRDVLLVGHSMGCRVVLQAHFNARQRVGAIALIDGSFRGESDAAQAERAMRAAIETEGYPAFARRLIGEMFLQPGPQVEAAVARGLRLGAERGTALYARMIRWDSLRMGEVLSAAKVPLLAMQSTAAIPGRGRVSLKAGDTMPWLEMIRERIPHARIEIIPGVGHFTQMEAPDKVNALLSTLL
jgi:pimeloyl-ACP methyl ester carboxylesterase